MQPQDSLAAAVDFLARVMLFKVGVVVVVPFADALAATACLGQQYQSNEPIYA